MRTQMLKLIGLLLLVWLPAVMVHAQNPASLQNNDFETWNSDDVSDWIEVEPEGGIVRELSTVLSGTYSVKMVLDSLEGPNLLYQDLVVWPRDSVQFSVYLRNGNSSTLKLYLQFYTGENPAGDPVENNVSSAGAFWSLHTIEGQAPDTADAVRFIVEQEYNVVAGRTQNVYVDLAEFNVTAYTCDVSTNNRWYLLGVPSLVTLAENRVADSLFSDDLGGLSSPGTWVMSRWNPATLNYDRFGLGDNDPNIEPPDIEPGLGYWFVQNVEPGVEDPWLDVVSAQTTGAPEVNVSQTITGYQNDINGMTMLANPFYGTYQLNTSTITVGGNPSGWGQDGINSNVYTFNGSSYEVLDATLATSYLFPWQGFWVIKTTTGDAELEFSYDGGSHGPSPDDLEEDPRYYWFVDIPIETVDGEHVDHYNKIGVREGSEDDYDPWDAFEFTPPITQYVNMSFPHDNWDVPGRYAWDLRDWDSIWEYWVAEVRVKNLPNTDIRLYWPDLSNLPPRIRVKLIMLEGNQPQVIGFLDEMDEFVFTSGDEASQSYWFAFRVVREPESDALLSVEDETIPIPDEFRIVSAYPNPFNSSVSVEVAIPQAGNTAICVFDVLGREVAQLQRGPLHAGTHQVVWNADDVASGTYLLRVNWQNQEMSRKLTLVK